MNKPKGYDETQSYTESRILPAGGYICKVMGVKESKSRNGKEMLEISLDIDDGEYKGYYADKYKNDTRKEKKWGCVVYQLTEDENGNCNRGLKTFLTSIEESNSGFSLVWGDKFCDSLKNKKVGGVFRREEFKTDKGTAFFTKCISFRSIQTIKDGIEVPADKLLEENKSKAKSEPTFTVDSVNDDDLPF